jgi:hypothetical protein
MRRWARRSGPHQQPSPFRQRKARLQRQGPVRPPVIRRGQALRCLLVRISWIPFSSCSLWIDPSLLLQRPPISGQAVLRPPLIPVAASNRLRFSGASQTASPESPSPSPNIAQLPLAQSSPFAHRPSPSPNIAQGSPLRPKTPPGCPTLEAFSFFTPVGDPDNRVGARRQSRSRWCQKPIIEKDRVGGQGRSWGFWRDMVGRTAGRGRQRNKGSRGGRCEQGADCLGVP